MPTRRRRAREEPQSKDQSEVKELPPVGGGKVLVQFADENVRRGLGKPSRWTSASRRRQQPWPEPHQPAYLVLLGSYDEDDGV